MCRCFWNCESWTKTCSRAHSLVLPPPPGGASSSTPNRCLTRSSDFSFAPPWGSPRCAFAIHSRMRPSTAEGQGAEMSGGASSKGGSDATSAGEASVGAAAAAARIGAAAAGASAGAAAGALRDDVSVHAGARCWCLHVSSLVVRWSAPPPDYGF